MRLGSSHMDEYPIFVTGSGRRRLVLRWSGIAVAIMLAGLLCCVGIAMISEVTVPPPTAYDDRSSDRSSAAPGRTSEAAGR
jgi:hypothetical protein